MAGPTAGLAAALATLAATPAAEHGSSAILAGLNSPLASAGLMPTMAVEEAALTPAKLAHPSTAETHAPAWQGLLGAASGLAGLANPGAQAAMPGASETPAAPQAESTRARQPAANHAQAEAAATQPLAPAWITALHTPEVRVGPWPRPHGQQRQDGHPPEGRDEGEETDTEAAPGNASTQAPETPADDRAPPPWPGELHAQLPAEVQAELARYRSVLVVAPPGPGQRGLQLVCVGFDSRARPVCHRWAVRGASAATDPGREWRLWRVRREGDDGQRPVLSARAAVPGQALAGGLVLRATATVLPAPLRPAHHAWLDVLEPQRLWRDLGSQWTLLLAWSPQALPLGRP